RSTQDQLFCVSPACLGNPGIAPRPSTDAGRFSRFGCFTCSLTCVPWLHGHYPLHGYYGRSDFRPTILRPRGHERPSYPARKFTAYFINPSCHSVSTHRICAVTAFLVVTGSFRPDGWLLASVG